MTAAAQTIERLQMQSEIAQLPLIEQQALVHRQEWLIGGRPDQMPPPEEDESWFLWLMMAGRGSGKTRAGAEDVWWFGYLYPGSRIAVVAPTSDDCRKTCFEGESGLLARCPPHLIANWNRGEKVLTLTNGTIYQGYSAQEPDRLRGPQHHRAWCDELAAWPYLDATLDNLLMGLRLGRTPRIVATTTPRPIDRIKEIVRDKTTWVDTVSTYANIENLPKMYREQILKRYEGTRLGRQELMAEILKDVPGALWQRDVLDQERVVADLKRGVLHVRDREGSVTQVTLQRIVVGVDPASGGTGDDGDATSDRTGDEVGILVVGLGDDGRGYVLADRTVAGASPAEWGEAVVMAYDDWGADRVVYEANQGGEMVRHTVVTSARAMRDVGKRKSDFVPTEAVWASRGKVTRAEPVSALYAQRRVSHVGCHSTIEDQMCEFTSNFDRRKMGYSPDRVDALVWAVTHLMLNEDSGLNVQDFYRQEHNRHQEAMRTRGEGLGMSAAEGELVPLVPPPGQNTVFGVMGNMYNLGADGIMRVHLVDVDPLIRAGYTHAVTEEAS